MDGTPSVNEVAIAPVQPPSEDEPDADETRIAVEASGGKCLLPPGDLSSVDACDDTVDRTIAAFGRLDILVANAGRQHRKKSLAEVSDDEFDATFKTNRFYLRTLPDDPESSPCTHASSAFPVSFWH